MPDINRPHIAALLRIVASDAYAAAITLMDTPSDAEAKLISSCVAALLRQRADEIEGRT